MPNQPSRKELEKRIAELEMYKRYVGTARVKYKQCAYTPDTLQGAMDFYFDTTPVDKWTITGLALSVVGGRETLRTYGKRPEYEDIVKAAKLKVEHAYELELREYGRSGTQFALRQFGWRDGQEAEMRVAGGATIAITVQLVQPGAIPGGGSAPTEAIDITCSPCNAEQVCIEEIEAPVDNSVDNSTYQPQPQPVDNYDK
jgi:hypothetical protein